jgi:hypothetical protein
MSIRTVIEVNHDYLADLAAHPENFSALLMMLRGSVNVHDLAEAGGNVGLPGLRLLGQRHHSETLKLTVK